MTEKICEAQLRIFFKEGKEHYHHEAKMGLNCPECNTQIGRCTVCHKYIEKGQRVMCIEHIHAGMDGGDFRSETDYEHIHYKCYKKITAKRELICDNCGQRLNKCDTCKLPILKGEVIDCSGYAIKDHSHKYCYDEKYRRSN